MTRSFIHLRRALFGVSCAIVMGAGASEAVGHPGASPRVTSCPATGDDYAYAYCNYSLKCGPTGGGYCSAQGWCKCGPLP
jgi:hypothetical protein